MFLLFAPEECYLPRPDDEVGFPYLEPTTIARTSGREIRARVLRFTSSLLPAKFTSDGANFTLINERFAEL